MVGATAVNAPLLLVSDDRSLIRLVRLECHELALALDVASAWQQHTEERPMLIDLDSIDIPDDIMRSEAQVLIGICRDDSVLLPEHKARFTEILQRPFPTAQLRALLGEVSGRGVMISQVPNELPSKRVVTNASDVALMMQGDHELRCGEQLIRLSPTEAAMMQTLIAHRGDVVSRQMLEECLRGEAKTDSNKIEVYLCFLRRKIERPLGLRLITTVRGKGYRLE
jgi:hypothetical protein